MTRVFIVSDSLDRTAALAAQLEEDERFEISSLSRADVLLCLGLPLKRLPRRGRPVVAISLNADEDAPFDSDLKAWLPASATLDQIAASITAAALGLTVLTRQQTRRVFHHPALETEHSEPEPLTVRELEVLQLLAAGHGNKAIAARLNISLNTAKFHVAQILAKLGASSRTEAVSLAIRRGAVTI